MPAAASPVSLYYYYTIPYIYIYMAVHSYAMRRFNVQSALCRLTSSVYLTHSFTFFRRLSVGRCARACVTRSSLPAAAAAVWLKRPYAAGGRATKQMCERLCAHDLRRKHFRYK